MNNTLRTLTLTSLLMTGSALAAPDRDRLQPRREGDLPRLLLTGNR